jgi:hypothetical protein
MSAAIRIVSQMAVVTAILDIAMIVADTFGYRSGWNIIWLIAIPFGVARLFDRGFRGSGVWPLVGLFLLVWSWFAMGLLGAVLGIGP